MAEVVEINNLEDLEPYRLAWNALLHQTPRSSFFHTYHWLENYWQHFGHDQRLRVLVILANGSLIGIIPLCVRTERYQVGKVQVLGYPLGDWGTWYGPIGPNQSASLTMALRYLRNQPRDWDMLDLRWVDPALSSRVSRALQNVGWQSHVGSYQQVSVIQFGNTDWQGYNAALSKKWRHEIGRQARVLERNYKVSFERHRPQGSSCGENDPRWDLFDDCLAISERSWQSESKTGNTLCHGNVRHFLSTSHRIASHLGMLDMAVLKLDNQPVAFQYNYHYDGQLYGLRMGFDRSFAREGPGKVLMSRLIEDSFSRGDMSLDLGIGDFAFKRRFRTSVETSCRTSCYPWTAWRSQGVRLTRWIKNQLGPGGISGCNSHIKKDGECRSRTQEITS